MRSQAVLRLDEDELAQVQVSRIGRLEDENLSRSRQGKQTRAAQLEGNAVTRPEAFTK